MRYILLFTLICSLQRIYAQEEGKEPKLFKNLKTVVVTGQIAEKYSEEAVHKVRIISAKKLKSGLYTNLGQILEKELNIKLSQDNILGSSISLQGISGQNIKILIDEIPVIGRLNGNIDLSQISLNNIERIEIIEGPLSTLYGTDALAGTINIITNKSPQFNKSFNLYYETVGRYNLDFILSNSINNKTIIYEFARNYFNGWSENQEYKLIPSQELANKDRFKQWKPKEQFIHKIQYNFKKNNLNMANYIESFSERIVNRGLPREPYFENAFDEYYQTYRTNIGSNINFKNDKNKVQVLLAYNKYKRTKETFYKDLTNLSSTLVQDPSAQDTSSFNLIFAKAIISSNKDQQNLQYQFGIESKSESAKGARILGGKKNLSDYALFSTLEYSLNNIITFRPSVRFIHNTKYKAPTIPALNILLDFNKYKLRLGLAKGYRAPSIKELYLEFIDINHNIVGNQNLYAEESSNYHVNNSYTYTNANINIKTDISAFYNKISNKIDLANSTIINDQYSYFNIEEYKTKGISSSISLHRPNFEINIGLSYIGRFNKLANSESIPEFNFSTDYNLSTTLNIGNKTKVNFFFKQTGKLTNFLMSENNIVRSYTDSYNLLDFSINRRINDFLTLSIAGKNLLNTTYINRSNDLGSVHSSSTNTLNIGYGRTFLINLNFRL